MSKIALVNLANLQNENTAVSAINTNNATITNAIDNTLSLNGNQPNAMQSNLDMNSFQILNLPSPATMNSPARLVDVVTNPTVTVTLPVSGNNTWTGTNTFNGVETFVGDAYFKSGRPWFDVRAFGCVGDGVTNDTANFQACINAAAPSAGLVFVPAGNYKLSGGVTVPTLVRLMGAGKIATTLQSYTTDVTVVTCNGGQVSIDNLSVHGKGTAGDNTTFGSSNPALVVNSSGGYFRDMNVQGGSIPLQIIGSDNHFQGISTGYAYGGAAVQNLGANWFIRCAFDHSTTGVSVTSVRPYTNWAASTAYTVGQIAVVSGYAIQCTTAGTSGLSAPTLKNYGFTMVDNTAQWMLAAPTFLVGYSLANGYGENHFLQCDFSSSNYFESLDVAGTSTANGPRVAVFTDSVMSAPVGITSGQWIQIKGCELADQITVNAGFAGVVSINNNWFLTGPATSILIGANVNNFIISGNYMAGKGITVQPGTSNHYIVSNNFNCTVTDGGTGAAKNVSGNVA